TIEVRQVARELMNSALNAETSVRGFLLTDDASFLEPYDAALSTLPGRLDELRRLTADNPDQQKALERLTRSSAAILEVYRQMLAFARQGDRGKAIDLVRVKAGKGLMDDLRAQIDAFARTEMVLLEERQVRAHTTRIALAAAAIGALALVLGLAV